MSGSVIHSQSSAMVPAVYSAGQSAQLPVVTDYLAALALRQMSMVHDELPKYLLAPEVSALLHYIPDLRRKMLLATLWNTGARINEALALTRGDFSLAPPYPFVQLATLKQRTKRPPGRQEERHPAGRLTGWFRSPTPGTSASCRRWWQH